MCLDELSLMIRPEFTHNLQRQILRAHLVQVRKKALSLVLVNTFHELECAPSNALQARDVLVTTVGPLLDDEPVMATTSTKMTP